MKLLNNTALEIAHRLKQSQKMLEETRQKISRSLAGIEADQAMRKSISPPVPTRQD